MGVFQKLKPIVTGIQSSFNKTSNSVQTITKQTNVLGQTFKKSYGQLEDQLRRLEKGQKAAFNTVHIAKYQSMIDKTKSDMDRLNKVINPAPAPLAGWAKYKDMMQQSASEIPGLSRGMSLLTNPMALVAGTAALIGVGLMKSTEIALNFNEGMAKVNATAQLGDESLGKLKGRLKDIGSNSGGNFERIPEAYEKILSQTNKVNLSLNILEIAVKGAKAGFTDIDTVAGALARTLSIVGEKNTSAAEVMDTLFAAKKYGAGEFKDFAQYLPQLIADAKVLGINFKDTAGLFAFMTAKGQSATDATMLMKNAFTAMNKLPILKEMEKTGIKVFDAKGMRRNISDILGDFTKKWQGLSDKGRAIFLSNIKLHDAQALTAFSVLTSDAEKFKEIMGGVNNSIGETNRQLSMTQNYKRTWADVGDDLKNMGESIGAYLLPIVDAFVTAFKGLPMVVRDIANVLTIGMVKSTDGIAKEKVELEKFKRQYASDKSASYAQDRFKELYGYGINDKGRKYTRQDNIKYNSLYQGMYAKLTKDNKNNIDPNEGTSAEKALNNVNKGLPVGAVDPVETKGKGASTGNRSLIMNIKFDQKITAASGVDVQKLADDVMDKVTDALRDGVITIGV